MARSSPTLSIGLPVYNGEQYLEETLECLLGQSFSDFELLIVDNASTDATAGIALAYADRDARIRCYRNPQNIGAAKNFNRAFQMASAPYFKWAAHDDLLHPRFLEQCVGALEHDSGAVLAYPRARIIDGEGEPVADYDPRFATDAPHPAIRFASMLDEHKCFQIFGVIRRDALRQTNLIGLHAHGDGVLLAHLALLGRFVEVPEFLFYPRRHPGHSSTMIGDYWSYAAWFNPAHRRRMIFPHCRMFGEYVRVLMRAPISTRDRLAAGSVLLRILRQRWRLIRGDILYYVRPRLVALGVPEHRLRVRTSSRRVDSRAELSDAG